ncbi:hypothetical protein K469DRAFT_729389 [Zopfia rhizophila CBS 207.26]|uniref:Uncharacterized protein n=1 Tax=Zopfia rhizophila CBS 207.26 TaxID=1314779 RepID=A0A6A6DU10_9PEZI|nr:hypothetical protein K469DRAFT_729389 [Zopfia rhizophila CBS 207.26]
MRLFSLLYQDSYIFYEITEISRLGLKDLNTLASALITNSPPNSPFRLEKDTSHIYITQNAARYLDSSLKPLFRALYVSHPSFNITSINVSSYKREDFTIHIKVTNNTAIFYYKETKTDEYISPNKFRGYGHSFKKKCTSRQVNRSTRHHRIISYRFRGLKFIIYYKTDGYVTLEVNDLSSVLDSLSLSPKSSNPGKTYPASSKLVIRKEGQAVPLPLTLEIKTRVAHRPLTFEDVVSQLWVLQTPKLVRAYHTKGVFTIPKVKDIAIQDLRMLAGLIRKIRNIIRESSGRAILKYNTNRNNLVFNKLGGEQMLPKGLYIK